MDHITKFKRSVIVQVVRLIAPCASSQLVQRFNHLTLSLHTMPTGGEISKQVDIGQIIRDGGQLVGQIIAACSADDVQLQAVLAFETLGQELLVHPDRINDAVDALGGSRNQRLNQLQLTVGYNGDSLANRIRNSLGCTQAFALVMACRTCYDDSTVGKIIQKLMVNHGVFGRGLVVSTQQLIRLIEAISPNGLSLIPNAAFSDLANRTMRLLDSSTSMPGLLSELAPEEIPDILHPVFEAIQDQENQLITLEGCLGGVWLATLLSHLHKDTVQVNLNREILLPGTSSSPPRILVNFRADHGKDWHLSCWKNHKEIARLIQQHQDKEHSYKPHGIFPLASAREVLVQQHNLASNGEDQLCGELTAALVQVIFEKGRVGAQDRTSNVALGDICSSHFVTEHPNIAQTYGWDRDNIFDRAKDKIAENISRFIDEKTPDPRQIEKEESNYLECISKSLGHMEAANQAQGRELCFQSHNIEITQAVEVAVNLAAEAIYTCLYVPDKENPIPRFMLGYHYKRTMSNAKAIWRLIFNIDTDTDPFSLRQLHRQHFNSLLATAETRYPNTGQFLALSNNGIVVFLSCLKSPSLSQRGCLEISALPGFIRIDSDTDIFDGISQSAPEELPALKHAFTRVGPVRPFSGDTYEGLEPRSDVLKYEVCHRITKKGRELVIMTFLKSNSPPEIKSVGLDWLASVEAVATARRLDSSRNLSVNAERRQALVHREERSFDKVAWIEAGHTMSLFRHEGYITMTEGSDILRFFFAGRFPKHVKMLRGSLSLVTCIDHMMREIQSGESPPWIVIT